MTISGTRAVRSASQPKIGSLTSRAIGHAAMTRPSVARSMPCSVKYSGQDRQQPTEAEPDDELGEEQRQDAAPAVEPGRKRSEHGRRRSGRRPTPATGRQRSRRDGDDRRDRAATSPLAGRAAYTAASPPSPDARCAAAWTRSRPKGLVKIYKTRKREVRALDGVDLSVEEGTVLGPARPQRRRQDDDGPDPGDAPQAGRRPGHRRRLRRRHARRSRSAT